MTFSLFGGRRVLAAAGAGLVVTFACAVPTYHFTPETEEHCTNRVPDAELGESDLDCGGLDCHGCSLGQRCNTSGDCAEGECLGGFCQVPGCGNGTVDGSETGTDCGGGCPGCRDGQPCNVSADCLSKVCAPDGTCAAPTCMDGLRNGDELDLDCGGSCDGCPIGSPCVEAIGCQSRLCDPVTSTCALNCSTGTDECDGNQEVACETNLLTNADNCGACGSVCELAHAAAICSGGNCQVDACVAPYLRCNTDDEDGCEVNGSTDTQNCGACGMVCTDLHGSPMCVNAKCVINCDDGFGDCDEDPLTGCEASVGGVDNCGACGKKCPRDQGEPFCVDNECGYTDCEEGLGDCDGDSVCEASLDDDVNNCGACGNICSAANGEVDCVGGRCVISKCNDGFENCDDEAEDGGFGNGCEANVASDAKNCGSCGQRCDIVDHGNGTCEEGTCAVVCDSPYEDCDGELDNGCEADTTSDAAHCGGCMNACAIDHATPACVNSSCEIGTCDANYDDCSDATEGCETNVSNSEQHCGNCTDVCSSAGATQVSCTGGECAAPSCDGNHDNCDGRNENGCETDVTTPGACGRCGNVCPSARPNCVPTGSDYVCQAQITLANTAPYPTAFIGGSSGSFKATPHAGTDRLIFVALSSDSASGSAGAKPDSVKFNGTNMTPGPTIPGYSDFWSPDLFIYYLALGDSATEGSQIDVAIAGAAASNFIVQQFQFNGVNQTTPITDSAGGTAGTPDPPDPTTVNATLDLDISGSAIYSFAVSYWTTSGSCPAGVPTSGCPAWSVSPSTNLTVTETMATGTLNLNQSGSPAPARAFGMLVTAPSPSLPAAGSYQPSWTFPSGGRLTHLAVALAPARTP